MVDGEAIPAIFVTTVLQCHRRNWQPGGWQFDANGNAAPF